METTNTSRAWLQALLPIILLSALIFAIVAFGPAESLRGDAPPVEELHIQRVELSEAGFSISVLNDGPDPVTIAQVSVDEAYWSFTQDPPGPLSHLQRATFHVPYPWVEGDTHELRLVTATGITFDHTVDVALTTPQPGWEYLGIFSLIGLYVGVLPVALGLLWLPTLRSLGRKGMDFVLALTIGLLIFLFVDATHEGLEAGAEIANSYQGIVLFVLLTVIAYLAINVFGRWMKERQSTGGEDRQSWTHSLLIAICIGLHNFGEGLAIGAAFALGEAALGTLLIVGFTLHNTTEGLAIVAPLAQSRTRNVGLMQLIWLGLIAGAPTIAGAWLGGFVYSPVWSVAFLAIGAGAIAQVVVQILGGLTQGRPVSTFLQSGPVLTGLLAGFALMYATGALVG